MGKYDVLLQKNNSKEEVDFSKNKYVALLGDKKTSFKERMTGTPTKNYDNTYKANTGVIPFFKEARDNLFSGTVGTGRTLGESISVNRGDFNALNKANQEQDTIKLNLVKKINENKKLGIDNTRLIKAYNSLANTPKDTIESLAPNSQVSTGKAVGNLALMASGLLGAGTVSATTKTAGYVGSQAEKEALKLLTKQQLKKQFAKDVALNAGVGYMVDVGGKLQKGRTDAGVAVPGLGTALGTILPGLIGNQALNKTLNAQSEARIAEKYAQKFNIPEVGTPPPGYQNKLVPQIEAPKIQLPAPGVLKNQEMIRNPVKNTVEEVINKTPEILRAEKFNSRADFINNERQFFIRTKQKIPTTLEKKAAQIWDEAHATPVNEAPKKIAPSNQADGFRLVNKDEILPNGYTTKMNTQTGEQMTNAPLKDTPTPEAQTPNIKQTVDDSLSEIDNVAQQEINNKPLEVDSINLKAEEAKAKKTIEIIGKEKARRIALGIDEAPNGTRTGAIHSELSNIAQREGDHELLAELASSDIYKPSAQEINLARNREPNSFYWIAKDIVESKKKNRSVILKMNEKSEINNIANRLRKVVDSVTLDNLSIRKLAAKLICK